ncbi:MAG TPA: GAF domain-containing protein [Aggregatilineaceae bacterium]|nr:GAF domain-containing protein [Aggregatilineaceae bacterium]
MLDQQNLLDFYDTIQDIILVLDCHGLRILHANRAAQAITGYTEAELTSLTLLHLYPELGHAESGDFIALLTANKETRWAATLFSSDGTPIRTEIRLALGTWHQVPCGVCVARDTTNHKRTEEAFRRQRLVLEGVAQATSRLLANHDYAAAIHEALAILGNATGVDRIVILEEYTRALMNKTAMSYRFEWTNGAVRSEAGNSFQQNLAWNAAGLADCCSRLAAGEVINVAEDGWQRFLEGGPYAPAFSNPCSLLIVPIFADGRFWGSIGFESERTPREWTEDEVGVIRLLATSIGAAIERQQTEDKLRAEREISDTLREIGMALTSTLDLDEVLGRLLVQAKRVVSYEGANAGLLENGTARIVQAVGYETVGLSPRDFIGKTFRADSTPLMRKMVETEAPDFCLDVQSNPDWIKWPETKWINSWLGVPIVARGKFVGFLSFDSAQENAYSPEHVKLIEPIARQAAIAVENATLFASVRELERIKSEMIRVASHDLRGPLARLQIFGGRLADQLDSLLAPEQRGELAIVREAADDMERMISDILSLERIEARFREAQPINWHELIEQSLQTLRVDLGANATP